MLLPMQNVFPTLGIDKPTYYFEAISTYKKVIIFDGDRSNTLAITNWLKAVRKELERTGSCLFRRFSAVYTWKGTITLWTVDELSEEQKEWLMHYRPKGTLSLSVDIEFKTI